MLCNDGSTESEKKLFSYLICEFFKKKKKTNRQTAFHAMNLDINIDVIDNFETFKKNNQRLTANPELSPIQ